MGVVGLLLLLLIVATLVVAAAMAVTMVMAMATGPRCCKRGCCWLLSVLVRGRRW